MSKKVRRQAIGVALFPFLAVLICTMGALIVLLVLLVQQARLDAQEVVKNRAQARAAAAVDPHAAERKAAKEQVEDEQWRQNILEGQRTTRLEELANARLKVEHLEDHIRRLQDQARTMIARAREIDEGRASNSPDLTAEQTELARLQTEIAKRKADLDQKKKELAAKDRSYALIPYDGPNGTKRRPIYIECTARGVILQPEQVVLGPEDFSGPLNPGNPLDAALRAIREVWKRSGEPGEPYPLLVVRPDGIVAYQAAREALRGWDDEFGYELVDDQKKLDFGGPNPALQQQLIQIVGVARQRQVMLAAAMPRKFQAEDELTSFAAEDQPSYQAAIAAARGAGGAANGNGEFSGGAGNAPGGAGSGIGGRGSIAGSGGYNPGSTAPGIGTQLPSGTGTGAGSTGYPSGTNAQFAANSIQASRAGQGGAGGNTASGTAASGTTGTSNTAAGGYGQRTPGGGQASGSATANGQPGSGQPSGGQYGSAGQSSGQSTGQSAGAGQGSASSGQTSSGSSASGDPNTDPSSNVSVSGTIPNKPKAPARAGNNWGLPGSQGRTTAVTRPIRIVCLPDRLIVVPERGDDRAASIIPISPEMQAAEVDAFVVAVQKHLNSWGAAMTNGYWRPELQVEVTRAAEPQFETLKILLQGSGFEVKRKSP